MRNIDTANSQTNLSTILPILGSTLAAVAFAVATSFDAGLQTRGIATGLIAAALGAAVAASRSTNRRQVAVNIIAASVMLVPLIVSNPSRADIGLAATLIALILGFLRKPFASTAAVALITVTTASSVVGMELFTAAYMTFFVAVSTWVLSRDVEGRREPVPAGIALVVLSSVAAVTVNELAKRSTLPGTQLAAPRWGLLLLLVITAIGITTSRNVTAVLGRASTAVVTVLAVATMALTPAQGTAQQLRASDGGESILAAIAGSAGSTRMIGEEGAGPRAQFKGIQFDNCDRYSIRDCLITYFDEIAAKDGLQAAIDDVVDKVRNNQGRTFPTHCHQVIHNLGQLAFELTDGDFALVSSYDPQVCGTGFIHGLYEKYFNRYGSYIFTNTGDVCKDMNLIQDWYAWTCNHILGHIISTKMINNPIGAAEFCLQLLGTAYFPDCNSGAWMNFWSDDLVVEYYGDNFMDQPEEVFKICYGATRDVKFYCYQEIFPVLVKISNYDLPKMVEWCQQYAEPARGSGPIYLDAALDFSDRCIQGVARAVAVTSGYDYRSAILQCTALKGLAAGQCLSAAGGSVVLNTGSVTAGMEMCERVADKGYRDFCFIWVKQIATMLRNGPNSQNMPQFGETRTPNTKIPVPLPPKVTPNSNT